MQDVIKEKKKQTPKFELVLSDTKHVAERSEFTVMMLLGELGGLYSAIVGIPSFFISYFVQLQFMSAIAAQMPVKKHEEDGSDDLQPIAPQLKDQLIELKNKQEMPKELSAADSESLALEAARITKMPQVPFFRRLCYHAHFCKMDARIEMYKHVFEEFEKKLDVESIANDQMSLARFTNAFLSRPQKLLLSYQHDQALADCAHSGTIEVTDFCSQSPNLPEWKREKAFKHLITGFTAKTDFDKRLLLGMYKSQ